ncbi:outer membrane assembly lipoprotein YfiO [Gluconacetobacter diazotrophicus PA1 5]|uniref:Outer membrane protein assembly factor BamD n=1 Tax=Gluconacetobacter diazotrophicus TaxID=33996 RepID=A0A7W4FD58_GLUDI|nr:outer membrane protein assembly factor BamD [Gluconacetobacter diazotrophicus]ACI52892.1 outer membrane assembly lipoprotein YfiO [Gluconacetobacter diazotrophicus PA1 5]MBB2155369.1 outer membrane protein assembly factor BamD [Gluconacetobacter diazotrophicus]TWB08963.1 Beta-barrel assembly machine subunit BamD [Gluconacetobacter diazotrophicus]
MSLRRIRYHFADRSNGLRAARFASLALILSVAACGGDKKAINDMESHVPPVETLYNNGIDALRDQRYALAAAEFEVLQQNYPYSGYVANAQLMEGYANYLQDKYADAVQQLDRFLELHPTSADAAYAFYLRALCYYEQVAEVQRDQQGTVEAMNALEEVITRFPQSPYARDAQLKVDLCRDHLAGKEMLVGRFYEEQRNYEGAVNRYQRVVQDFQTTNHVPEALERLVEVYLDLGLTDQARRTASVLSYNYPGSKWYRFSYNMLRSKNLLDPHAPLPGSVPDTTPATPVDDTHAKNAPPPPGATPARRGFFSRMWHSVF